MSEKLLYQIAGGSSSVIPETRPTKAVFTMGGKGGTGKSTLTSSLVGWYDHNEIPVQLLDLDTENKLRGSMVHFFPNRAAKVNIHTPAGLDAFVSRLKGGAPIVLADMGAGAGEVTSAWFDEMYQMAAEAGIAFTAIGVVTEDPASVSSVLGWANQLQMRVSYLIVKNVISHKSGFSYWDGGVEVRKFVDAFSPAVIQMGYRLPALENATRNHGVTLDQVADRQTNVIELQEASLVMRAQSYRRALFAEFDRVKEVLLP